MAALLTINTDYKINAIKVIRTIMLGDKSLIVAKDCVECGIIMTDLDEVVRFIQTFEDEWKRDYNTSGKPAPTWTISRYTPPTHVPRHLNF